MRLQRDLRTMANPSSSCVTGGGASSSTPMNNESPYNQAEIVPAARSRNSNSNLRFLQENLTSSLEAENNLGRVPNNALANNDEAAAAAAAAYPAVAPSVR